MDNSLPEEFFRGISNSTFIINGCYLDKQAFHFDSYDAKRGDNYRELSITWNDNEDALRVLMEQRKPHKDEYQFKGGYCKYNRVALTQFMKNYFIKGDMDLERRAVEASVEDDIQANPYHGNILLSNDLPKAVVNNVESTLAALVEEVHPRS